MNEILSNQFFIIGAIIAVILFLMAGIIWLFFDNGIDKIKHPEEWKDAGVSGERIIYNTLVHKVGISEKQILRNVYVPIKNDKTSEIDLLVVSKKGLFIFECKNYGGNIYGDAKRQKWIQYIGNKKSFFYNPLLQNKNHAKYIKEFLKLEIPIVPLVTTISRGKWKIKNLSDDDYILGINCHFKDIYNKMPESEITKANFKSIMQTLEPLSRPDEETRNKHISQIKN